MSPTPRTFRNTDVGISGPSRYTDVTMDEDMEITTEYYDFHEFVARTVKTMVEAKLQLCEYFGGPSDGTPILLWGISGKDGQLTVHLLPLAHKSLGEEAPDVFYNALNNAFVRFGVPEYAAYVNEAYVKTQVDGDDMKSLKRGDIQREFQNSASPRGISECLTAFCFSKEGETKHSVIVYKYNDVGLPVFDEPIDTGYYGGAIVDVYNNFMGLIRVEK